MRFFHALLFITGILLSFISPLLLAEEQLVEIGAILHLTGDIAPQSKAFQEGIELARRELNERPTTIRYTVTYEDGQNAAKASHQAGLKLLQNKNVSAVIVESYLDVMSSGRLFERAKIPSICLWDSSPSIDDAGQYIFSIGPWTPSSGEVAAEFAVKVTKGKSAIIFYNPDSWSEAVSGYFQESFERFGGSVLEKILINPSDLDNRSVITKVLSQKPDVIYAPIVTNIVPFYKQLYQVRPTMPIVSTGVIAEEHLAQAPQVFEGIYQTNIGDPDSPPFLELKRRYERTYGKPLLLPWFVATGYDALMVIHEAITRGGVTKEGISAALYTIKNFQGASSEITINERGSSAQRDILYKVVGGRFVKVSRSVGR